MTPKKSLTLKMPRVPDKYLAHFIRGYFDGDGAVSIIHYKRKSRNNKNSATILSGFICGNKKFLEEIFVKLKKDANISGGTLYFHSNGHRLTFSVKDSLKLYKFMYKNPKDLFLTRKRKIFEKYFKIG